MENIKLTDKIKFDPTEEYVLELEDKLRAFEKEMMNGFSDAQKFMFKTYKEVLDEYIQARDDDLIKLAVKVILNK